LRLVSDRLSLDAQNRLLSGPPSTLGFLTGNAPNVLIAPGEVSVRNKRFQAPVGRIIARYAMFKGVSSYLSYARGRRPNVIQLRADAQPEILDDENVNSYEVGVKGTFADRTLWDAAAFYYDYSDFQTRSFVADQETGEFQLIVKDGGKAHAYGFETGLRHTLSEHIQVNASYAYIHARFDQKDSNGNDQEYGGNTFRLTPEHTWSLTARFTRDLGNKTRLFIAPFYSYKSHHYFEDDNSEGLEQNGYGLFHVQGGMYYKPWQLELRLFAYNLLDKDYLVSAGNTGNLFGIPTFVPGRPQTFGARLSWGF
jgi:outer membrane receptor protein involved in Fe transport